MSEIKPKKLVKKLDSENRGYGGQLGQMVAAGLAFKKQYAGKPTKGSDKKKAQKVAIASLGGAAIGAAVEKLGRKAVNKIIKKVNKKRKEYNSKITYHPGKVVKDKSIDAGARWVPGKYTKKK